MDPRRFNVPISEHRYQSIYEERCVLEEQMGALGRFEERNDSVVLVCFAPVIKTLAYEGED